jgi:hypothetical protein
VLLLAWIFPIDVAETPPTVHVAIEVSAETETPTRTAAPDATFVCVQVRLVTLTPAEPADDGPTASNATAMSGHRLT